MFLGFHQTDDIKCEQGMRIKKIKMDKEGKDYLDCHLIDSITKRKNLPNTTHYIVSHDKGFEPWVNYLNSKAKKVIAKRIDKIDL